jgi:phosphonate transport system substrate-binding protein
MFKNGDIQLAWFGGLTGVQARLAETGAHAIAQGVEDPAYFSYFIAHADAGLVRSDEFPMAIGGLPFSFGSESSTSGRLMPEFFIREHTEKTPEQFFAKGFSFSGAHDKTAKLVESGQVSAGALSYKTYDKLVERGDLDPAKAMIIWKTPEYADYNFTAHPDLDAMYGEDFTGRLQAVLVGMTDEQLLSAFPRQGLIEARDAEFEQIERVARDLGMVR